MLQGWLGGWLVFIKIKDRLDPINYHCTYLYYSGVKGGAMELSMTKYVNGGMLEKFGDMSWGGGVTLMLFVKFNGWLRTNN